MSLNAGTMSFCTMCSLRGDFSMAARNQVPEIRNFKEALWWILIGIGIGGWLGTTAYAVILAMLVSLIIWEILCAISKATNGAINKAAVITREALLGAVIGAALGKLIFRNDVVAIILAMLGILVRITLGNEVLRMRNDE